MKSNRDDRATLKYGRFYSVKDMYQAIDSSKMGANSARVPPHRLAHCRPCTLQLALQTMTAADAGTMLHTTVVKQLHE